MRFTTLSYAGHSAVFLHAADFVVAIDPWLNNPLCPRAAKNPERIDLIALTHGHSDHAGDALALAKRYRSKVVATYELLMILVNEGLDSDQILPMNKGGSINHHGIRISLTHALHSSSYDSSKGTVYAGEPCGIVIRDESQAIYHAGDTALFSDLALIGKVHQPRVALLPIGDRFTMGPTDAAAATKLLGCEIAIPIHHSTFPLLSGTPREFTEAVQSHAPEAKTVTLSPGESYSL